MAALLLAFAARPAVAALVVARTPAVSTTAPVAAGGPVAAAGPATNGQAPGSPLLGPDPNAQVSSLSGPGPLAANGLGSPSCRDPTLRAQLSAAARTDCAASGVAVDPAPLEHYQLDVHMNHDVWGSSWEEAVSDLLVKPVWMALVWLTHVAIVAVEWCFSLDLLGTRTLGPIARGLADMRDVLTTPWLAPVLAVAAIALVYNGIVRRRVIETLGHALLLAGMMIAGFWVIADPGGTVGAVGRMTDEASLATLGAAATGDPNHPLRGLDDALGPLFDAAITGPWCYLEFGDVDWCREPSRLDPGLVAAARAVLAHDRSGLSTPASRRDVAVEAQQIGAARTNGELFLALPSNGPRRNSINADADNPSLLRTLCGAETATACPADTGPQAEFRTEKGTSARVTGLLLIAIGMVGMLALIGFLVLRLLGAALLALVYLLLAPVAVLAPAFGDGGRAAFRQWSLRLIGAVLAKLVYAVFLGAVLMIVRVLAGLGSLGWWTQWLLVAAFWWLAFNHRHSVLEHVIHERAEQRRSPSSIAQRIFATRQAVKLAVPPARALSRAGHQGFELLRNIPAQRKERSRRRTKAKLDKDVAGSLERDHAAAITTLAQAPARERELGELRARRDRLTQARRDPGDPKRAASLDRRQREVGERIASGERELEQARTAVAEGEERRWQTRVVHDAAQRTGREELFEREGQLRPRLRRSGDFRVGERDYAALASSVGLSRRQYEQLSGTERMRAQLKIDRGLEAWRESVREQRRGEAAAGAGRRPVDPRPARRPVGRRQRQFEGAAAAESERPARRRPPRAGP